MGRLKRVQRIDAANNMLVRVPPSMGYLKSIKELNLRYNNLDDKYKAKADEGLSRCVCRQFVLPQSKVRATAANILEQPISQALSGVCGCMASLGHATA